MTTEETIIGMERRALERWGAGDPDGFLEICAQDVTYFDPFVERRIDGIAGLRALYETLRGRVRIDSFELVHPSVQCEGAMAVLSYQFVSESGAGTARWNTTEVYRETRGAWRILHTHWAFTQAKQ
jgi:ketosteroid isomerase-like protein